MRKLISKIKDICHRIHTVISYAKFGMHTHEYDYEYLLLEEQFKLKRMYKSFDKNRIFENSDIYVSRIGLCIKLLDIVLNQDYDDEHYVNIKNLNRYFDKKFVDFFTDLKGRDKSLYDSLMIDIRVRKAFVLYNKMRIKEMSRWWF